MHLFRNLLSAEPLFLASSEAAHAAQQVHCELVTLLESELVLEILLMLAADLEQRENAQYNLLVMELLHHLLRNQDPAAVARVGTGSTRQTSRTTGIQSSTTQGSLKQQLQREKQSLNACLSKSTRHSHFAGTIVVNRGNGNTPGKQILVSAARLGDRRLLSATAAEASAVARRRNKKTDAFIGQSMRSRSSSAALLRAQSGPTAIRAMRTLHTFCERFVRDCYGPVMKSLKNEFRRDSVRLEDNDRVVFFRIVWFFCQWWRLSGKKLLDPLLAHDANDPSSKSSLQHLIFTMDIFTFNLVLNAIDTFPELQSAEC